MQCFGPVLIPSLELSSLSLIFTDVLPLNFLSCEWINDLFPTYKRKKGFE